MKIIKTFLPLINQMAMNINFNRQKLIPVFFYFSNNNISFFPPPSHLQFKMVRRANDDFILSFLTLMSIFPRAYFPSPPLVSRPCLLVQLHFSTRSAIWDALSLYFRNNCVFALALALVASSVIWMNELSRNG